MSRFVSHRTVQIALFAVCCLLPAVALAGESRWSGVDESVIEKIAQQHGREAREPLINTDQGDLLLFVFLLAGAVGGFVAGYYWRALTEKRDKATITIPGKNGTAV